ncbi:hypothetical protein ACLIBH_13030 [Virgibacillus sp. W0430]|uniref:hypothetical protein n=1 Tax=Virgibacillus sp. W0430 TaxID=3391580 RepID=UPI003F450685
MNETQKYYVSGHTAAGFVNYLSSNLNKVNNIIVLQHPSYKLKTDIITRTANVFKNKDGVEMLHHPLSSNYLEGTIIRNRSLAVVTEEIGSKLENANRIQLNSFTNINERGYTALSNAKNVYKKLANETYNYFAAGLKIHDELEDLYIRQMDYEKANELAEQFITDLLSNVDKQQKTPHVYNRLFGTNTAEGVVNLIPEITEGISNRVFVKGRAGTGKSVFMRKVMEACQARGLDVERYHCSFDPKSVDMIVVRDLDFCIFDSTDPHEFFPSRSTDCIVDLYEEAVTPGTDEAFSAEINLLTVQYKEKLKKGVAQLKKAGRLVKSTEAKIIRDEAMQSWGQEIIKKLSLPI